MNQTDLRDWVKTNMTLDESNVLEQNKELVRRHIGLTKEGRVILVSNAQDALSSLDQISLYAIGKVYAKVAGYSEDETVSSEEFERELGIPTGTLSKSLTRLTERGKLVRVEHGAYRIPYNSIPKVLSDISKGGAE